MAQQLEIPFEYHDDKLGVKIKFLIKDDKVVSAHEESLKLISYNALNKRMKSKTQPERELRRASLGFDALVEYDSLIQQWRDALVMKWKKPAEQIRESFFAKHYLSDRKAFDFFAAHRYGENDNKLEPEVIELYTYNASVLNTVIEVKNKRKMYAKSLGMTGQFDIWQSLSNDVNAFQQVRHDLPTKPDSLRHKVNRYLKEGYLSIISGKYGKRNAAKVVTNEQNMMIEELLNKHQNLNNEQIVDIYNIVASSLGWKTIDAGVIANMRKKLDMYVFSGQHGTTELMHNKHMQIKRSKPSAAMLFWSMDGWDAELLYQKTTINSEGKTVTTYHNRLTVVMVLDPFNNYIVGYAIGTSESPSLIRQALKNALKHIEELFGQKYKPYQLQTDNYQLKNLTPTYEATAKHFTPAKVKNSKAKPIENFFDKFNEKHFQAKLVPNWSGHNVTSNNDNQVNDDYLNKIRHQFPDETGCRMQIVNAIENDRAEKVEKYVESFEAFPEDDKITMTINQFLRCYGQTTGYTNKFKGEGLTPTINGIEMAYDTFDLNFRKHMHEDWMVFYDQDDLSKVLVSNAKSRNGKLVEEIGNLEFILEEKYIQPMALYDQQKQDALERQKVFNFNKQYNDEILNRNEVRHEVLEDLFTSNPQLDTLRKLMLADSNGQHKDHKSSERKRMEKTTTQLANKQVKKEQNIIDAEWKSSQEEYLKDKVNLNKYAEL
ncbi:hypothetical protein HX004_14215 [Myroides sp. 1354]|uniref:hypothetical protein n=1 Tax=unclassified Myroides TaxID=2642485 RepID=UPI0025789CF8|nr:MULTISPECIES: hypothetical protein [unclassified Myroides]MDM1045910.1 hypothetical protein [Myroides sp. R163-1]MDM1056920.1 hypothetical protein [Myroides sp. 1354]MDM1070115.1 hypothetical protein [Myroides sp. 1372]